MAAIGNIVGGTGLFAVLAHGQMRSDLGSDDQRPNRTTQVDRTDQHKRGPVP
ncbi:hypothetical protein [Novosphingobium guangzhouense]|uniref:hypothetical protein n=1 Tax=Novosphingobium guangzhouense TaxID=1850347 RepID=UPI001FE46296|nr:hypothetical protein [Novosphingobium guangzhouense]